MCNLGPHVQCMLGTFLPLCFSFSRPRELRKPCTWEPLVNTRLSLLGSVNPLSYMAVVTAISRRLNCKAHGFPVCFSRSLCRVTLCFAPRGTHVQSLVAYSWLCHSWTLTAPCPGSLSKDEVGGQKRTLIQSQ